MRSKSLCIAAFGGLTMALTFGASTASAGSCDARDSRCNPGHVYTQSPVQYAPVATHYGQPYDHLRRFEYVQAPQVNVTRIETGAPMASITDAPVHGWPGCGGAGEPVCRQNVPAPMPAPKPMSPVAQPLSIAPPPPPRVECVTPTRVVCVNQHAPRPMVNYVGKGYNQANFTSRTYGDTSFHTGEAYLPTSRVNRNPADRDAVLRSIGEPVVGQARLSHNVVSGSSYGSSSYSTSSMTTSVMADGTYWEKASGPTMVDGMPATQVLCKRQAPMVQKQLQVVRPVIGVRTPVPVYVQPQMPAGCAGPAPVAMPHMGAPRPMAPKPQMMGSSRYGSSSWTH